MLKKSLILLSVSAAYFMQAQDLSVVKNSVEVYSSPQTVGSAKYMGMAGSMGALGGDISAINSNPATLGVFIASDVSATLGINNYKNETALGNTSASYNDNMTDLSNVGAAMVFETSPSSKWKFVNIGINYTIQDLDSYIDTFGDGNQTFQNDYTNADGSTFTDTFTLTRHAYNRIGNLAKFNIAVGANYDNKIYIGGAINVHGSNLTQYDTADFASQHDNGYIYTETSKQFTDYDESSAGVSLSAGIIAKVSQQFRLGVALETPTWWSIERVYADYDYVDYFSEDRRFNSPMKATFSGAYVASKNFAVNVDYTLGLGKPKYKDNYETEKVLNQVFDENYKNFSDLRIGAEYRVSGFRLRAGYGLVSSSFDNYLKDFVGQRQTIGVGLGYDFKSFYIDAAYQHVSSENTNYFAGGSYYTYEPNDNFFIVSPDAFSADLKNTQNNVFITLGWKF